MIRVVARAYRIAEGKADKVHPDISDCEVLIIAVRESAGKHEIVWFLGRTDGKPTWKTDLTELRRNKPTSGVFKRPWERIELFRLTEHEDEQAAFVAAPRLAIDAIADESAWDEPRAYWTWRLDGNTVRPSERGGLDSTAVLHKSDRSCVFLAEFGRTQFLIANVRLRNLLGSDTSPVMTWQFVVALGVPKKIDPKAIWDEHGDLKLRDILCCTWRTDNRFSSFSQHVLNGKSLDLYKSMLGTAQPQIADGKAMRFFVGERDPGSFGMKEFVALDALKFPILRLKALGDLQMGGLALVQRSNSDLVTLRFYARGRSTDTENLTGAFSVDSLKPFLIQEQVHENRGAYLPRGSRRGRHVEWHLLFVTPETSGPVLPAWWNENVADPLFTALERVHDGAPMSLVPRLRPDGNGERRMWMAAVAVRDHASNEAMAGTTNRRDHPPFVSTPALLQPATLTKKAGRAPRLLAVVPGSSDDGQRSAVFPVLGVHPSEYGASVNGDWAFEQVRFAVDMPGIAYSVELAIDDPKTPLGTEGAWRRMGALDIQMRPPRSDDTPPPKAGGRLGWNIFGRFRSANDAPEFDVEARIPVRVKAGAVDRMRAEILAEVDRNWTSPDPFADRAIERGFVTDEPVVIDLLGERGEALELGADEAVYRGRTHRLQLKLFRGTSGATEQRRIMVIDRAPFGVYLARAPMFADLTSAEASEVATWDTAGEGGAHWRFSQPPGGVEVFLPPQGVGEAMEKAKEEEHPNDPTRQAIDFRFTPHARLQIDPSFQDQRYGEAPWNVRRLFGYAEQRMPGSRLLGFDVELLYGLAGQARQLNDVMIAEVESRLGRPAGRQQPDLPWKPDDDQKAEWDRVRTAWGETRSQLTTRLGVLETYALDGKTLVIQDGLTWYQRGSDKESSSPARAEGKARLRFPLPDYDKIKKTHTGVENRIFEDSEGLAGGWTWGFSSLNILEAVLREPKSTSGLLTGLKFSALGGWGLQKVSFDENRTTVHADTTMGRTHFYSLERVGRIAVFWNRAKHVIVFERAVVPNPQFVKEQDAQLGRPMLRKVAEYVEFVECERAFPDSEAPNALRGCVTSLRCKTKKILVNSKWGQDVAKYGWRIPLWNPKEVNNPTYPRPQVQFGLAGDPEADVKTVYGLCDTPELLYFYTDTRPGTGADTNKWESIPGVDAGSADARWIDELEAPAPTNLPTNPEGRLPPEVAVPPGLHAFTYGIAPLERPVNLVADRVDGALNASLRNVTLMRANPRLPGQMLAEGTVLRKASLLYQETRRIEHDLRALTMSVGPFEKVKKQAKEYLESCKLDGGGFVKRAKDLRESFKDYTQKGKLCGLATSAADEGFDRCSDLFLRGTDELVQTVLDRVEPVEGKIAGMIEEGDDSVKAEIAKYRGIMAEFLGNGRRALKSTLASVADGVARVHGDVHTSADQLQGELDGLPGYVDMAFDGVVGELNRLAPVIDVDVHRFFGDVEAVRASMRATLARVNETIEKIERAALRNGSRLGKLSASLRKLLARMRGHVQNATRTGEDAFASILERRPDALAVKAAIKASLAEIARALSQARKAVTDILRNEIDLKLLDDYVDAVDKTVSAVTDGIGLALAELDELADVSGSKFFDGLEGELDAKDVVARVKGGEFASAHVRNAQGYIKAAWREKSSELRARVVADAAAVCKSISDELTGWLSDGSKIIGVFADAIHDLDNLKEQTIDALKAEIEGVTNRVLSEATGAFEEVREDLESSAIGPILQNPDAAIRLLRAFGDPPKLPQLEFNRAATAFLFGDPKDAIDITPATAWFDQANKDLKALGIRLPTAQILDRLIPAELKEFDIGKLLPDFAGLKLDKLFRGLKAPAALKDAVRITHELDRKRQRASVKADIDFKLPDKAELFNLVGLSVTLHRAAFNAVASIDAVVGDKLDVKIERRCHGSLTADWELKFSGQTLLTFTETSLKFDEGGRLRFDLSPDRIDLAPALRYLSDLAELVSYDEDGFTLRLLERNGVPFGAEATFAVSLPPLQYGTTGIIGAAFGAGLRLEAYPDFALSLQANISRRHSPFVFSVFILGGSGYLEASGSYLPFKNDEWKADVSIKLAASASLAFGFSVVSGQVAVLLGISVEYHRRSQQGEGGLVLGLYLQVLGRVEVRRLVSIDLSLLLEANYSRGAIVASGSLRLRIRFSRFIKIEVSTEVKYDFKSGRTTTTTKRQIETHPAIDGAKRLAGAAV